VEVQRIRDQVAERALVFQDRIKKVFDRREKPDDF